MLYSVLVVPPLACVLVLLFASRLSRRALIAIGIAFALAGFGSIAWLEWQYTAANTDPLTMPVSLEHSGVVAAAPVRIAISGTYEIWLEFDRGDEVGDFRCQIGDRGFEAQCPRLEPELDLRWALSDGQLLVGRGASDIAGWNARQAAIDPATAARERAAFKAYQARSQDPSNHSPLLYSAGAFPGERGRTYNLRLEIRRPVPSLAARHPRLVVGLSGVATKGLGLTVLVFALLWLIGGAVTALAGVRREAEAA